METLDTQVKNSEKVEKFAVVCYTTAALTLILGLVSQDPKLASDGFVLASGLASVWWITEWANSIHEKRKAKK